MGGWPWLFLFYFGRAPTPPSGTTRGFSKIHPPQSKKGLNVQNDIATWTISGWCYTILLGYILLNRPHAYICWSFVIDHDGQV